MSSLPRILIAEDEKVSLMKLQHFLNKEMGVQTLMAKDGEEAWELFSSTDVQFVISDWEMPRCDGPELCRRVRLDQRRYTYFIMLTAREGEADLLTGMESGADDYMCKPPNFDELKSRIKAGFRVLELEQRLAAQNAQLEKTLSQLQAAVTAAAHVQQRMLPDRKVLQDIKMHTGLDIAYRYTSCESLGGDVLNLDVQNDGRVLVFLGDVSGHGIAASLAAVSLSSNIRANLRASTDPSVVIGQANSFCCADFPEEVYASSVYLLIEPQSRHVTAVVAGHPPLLIIQPDGNVKQIMSSIPPLGMFADGADVVAAHEVELNSGDRLIAYTDGIIETRNEAGDMFTVEQLIHSLRRAHNAPLHVLPELLLSDMNDWRGLDNPSEDDVTVIAIEFA
jgi:phosphoserine phosphatase RsbU/P